MKPFNGIETTRQVRRVSGGTGIIAVTLHTLPAYAKKIIPMGARGYVTKSSPSEEMIAAILEAADGHEYICQEMRGTLDKSKNEDGDRLAIYSLSERELEVVRLVKEGLTSDEISEHLDIAAKTVQTHRYNIYRKLGVKNTATLIEFLTATAIQI